jgi:mono/diheme cytochrome c family protein
MKLTMHVTAILLTLTSGAVAQDTEVEAGAAYAEQVCSPCHAVRPHQDHSPLPQAPSFQLIATTPGMTELALTVFMQSSHLTMPNVVLEPAVLRSVIAYIRSLEIK